eukprot:2266017-Rhodomonas_salina.1
MAMIVAANPQQEDFDEALHALRYGAIAKEVRAALGARAHGCVGGAQSCGGCKDAETTAHGTACARMCARSGAWSCLYHTQAQRKREGQGVDGWMGRRAAASSPRFPSAVRAPDNVRGG